ncbi:MAG: hypothetical protein CM15mP49_22580 [Actinomycetota bacterium]|nr:MAG: hypothetical protein CM15mP49_22580 [Actinomycetota bacterium]
MLPLGSSGFEVVIVGLIVGAEMIARIKTHNKIPTPKKGGKGAISFFLQNPAKGVPFPKKTLVWFHVFCWERGVVFLRRLCLLENRVFF